MPLQGLEDLLPSHDPIARLVEAMRAGFEAEHGVDLGSDPLAVQRMQTAAKQAVGELATLDSTDVNLPFITSTANGALHLHATVTRAQAGI